MLIIGICCTVVLYACTGMIHKASEFYPPWFCFAIVIIGCIVLPVLMIFGGILNKIHVNQAEASVLANERIAMVTPEPEEQDDTERSAEENQQPETEETTVKPENAEVKSLAADSSKEAAATALPAREGGRLEFMKRQRLSRQVDPRALRKFGK